MSTTIPAGTWTVDPERSRVAFEVKHLGFATATGRFTSFEGRLRLAEDGADGTASGTVEVASVATGEDGRDGFLAGDGFFDAATHPQITFTSTELRPVAAGRFAVSGDLVIRGVSRPVALDARLGEAGDDGERIPLEVSGEVRRSDYGLKIDGPSNALIGDKVAIALSLSVVRAS